MASDTAPPIPTTPPAAPGHQAVPQQPAGGLTGLLSAVDPARPEPHTFTLPPTDTTEGAGGGASSADFDHDPTTATSSDTGNGKSSSQQGVIRTWLLTLAKRHEQAGAARLKALDVKKARATALQVKEQRTTNRSEKIVGGNTGNSTNTQSKADKSNGTTNRSSGTGGATKNGPKNGPAGGRGTSGTGTSGTGGRGGSSGNGMGGGRGGAHGPNNGHSNGTGRNNGKTDTGKTNTPNSGKGTGTGSGSGGKDGSSGKPGSTGKDGGTGKAGKDGKTTTPNGSTGPGSASGGGAGKDSKQKTTTSTCGDDSGLDLTKTKKPKDQPAKAPNAGAGKTGPQGATGGSGASGGPSKTPTPAPNSGKADLRKNPDTKGGTKAPDKTTPTPGPKTTKDPNSPKDSKDSKSAVPVPGPRIDTQKARETGYQDGTRLAYVVSQAEAYKDGVKDGYRDTRGAAAREKDRLDKARQQNQQPTPPVIPPKPAQPPVIPPHPKDPPMTTTAPTQPATPVQVKSINASTLVLGDGAARSTISRGEVRTLKHFERALDARTATLTKAAENTKVRHAEALEYATKAAKLLEEAKAVKGGDKLAGTLTRLQETAQLQAMKAEETHRRAVRAADTCRALVANLKTRYEPLYQAVVNSPETGPAETAFYLGDHSG